MPYKIFKEGSSYCVHKMNADDSKGPKRGCSDSHAMAVRHQRALYAAEEKGLDIPDDMELKELEAMLGKDYMEEMTPWGARTFADLDAVREAQHTSENLRELTYDFQMLVNNNMNDPAVDVAAALKTLADEYATRVESIKSGDMMSEDKALDLDEKAVWSTAYVNNLPDASFLWVEPGTKDGEGKTTPRSLRHLPYKDAQGNVDLPHVRVALARVNQLKDKHGKGVSAAKIASLSKALEGILKRANKEAHGLLEKIGQKLGLVAKEAPVDAGMMVWKEADRNEYRWLARYSNNLRDRDYPPEIISAASHQAFVDAVERKEAELPELWLWHVPEWKVGQADWVAWDEAAEGIGFALAGGTFDKEAEWVAEALAALPQIGVSHGMPRTSLAYDPDDPTVITAHISKEISPLPVWAAANQWADFMPLPDPTKEQTMTIPTKKRDALVNEWGFDPQKLAELETRNQQTAKEVSEEIEHKETTEAETEVVDEVPTPPSETPDPETQTPPSDPVPPVATLDETVVLQVAEAVKEVLKPVVARVEAIETRLKELSASEEAQITEKVKGIPVASMSALLVKSIIGSDDARVDGRTELGKSKPTLPAEMQKEANSDGNNLLGGVIQTILSEHTHTQN